MKKRVSKVISVVAVLISLLFSAWVLGSYIEVLVHSHDRMDGESPVYSRINGFQMLSEIANN